MDFYVVAGATVFALVIGVLFAVRILKPSSSKHTSNKSQPAEKDKKPEPEPTAPQPKPQQQKVDKKALARHHHLQLCVAKGHIGRVNDGYIGSNGKLLCSISEDRTIRLFAVAHLTHAPQKYIRINTEDETPTACAIDHENRFACVATQLSRSLRIYAFDSKGHTSLFSSFPTQHQEEITMVRFFDSRTVFSFSRGLDTPVLVHGIDGTLKQSIKPNQMVNHALSFITTPAGRCMFSVAAGTSEARIWMVALSDKVPGYTKADKVMLMSAHKGSVLGVALSEDGDNAVTCGKDKTIKYWNIRVRFELSEDPKVLVSRDLDETPLKVALAPNKQLVAVAFDSGIRLLSIPSFELIDVIPNDLGGAVKQFMWSPDSKLLICVPINEKNLRIFRNPLLPE
eukprot:c1877_g1_i1.p1 GENE.c1877_g1_i1~~c1877_g1_i1.p1  ORF type:complete len:413 (+),score=97.33 c1877_g1_i1:50-1240(+)